MYCSTTQSVLVELNIRKASCNSFLVFDTWSSKPQFPHCSRIICIPFATLWFPWDPKWCPSSIYNISNLFFFLFFLVSLVTHIDFNDFFFQRISIKFHCFSYMFSISLICSKSYNFFSSAYLDLILFPLLVFCAGKLYHCFLHLFNFLIYGMA